MIRSLKRYLPLPLGRAAALVGSLAGGVLMTTVTSGAAALQGDALRDAVTDREFVVFAGSFRGEAEFGPDGTVVLTTVFGTFEGEWSVADRDLCLFFASGPRMGYSCVELSPKGQSYIASNGTLFAGYGE